MPPDNKRHYEVGYGKPPRRTRFTKGQSGNPRGRVRGGKNLKTLLDETLNEPVIVAENGGRRKISKLRAIIKQLVNKQLVNQSAKGDWRVAKMLLDFIRENERSNEPASAETSVFSQADERVLEQLRARFSKAEK